MPAVRLRRARRDAVTVCDRQVTSERLRQIRALLLDVDGVLHVGRQPIPGAADFLSRLSARRLLFRLLTNTTTASRATLAARLREIGLPVEEAMLVTAVQATAAYVH